MSKLEWNDIKEVPARGERPKRKEGESQYADLDEGNNYFRVVSDDIYGTLWYYIWNRFQKSSDAYGTDDLKCPLTKEVDDKGQPVRARPYYLFKVIERKSGKVKALRVSRQVANMMKKLKDSADWGPLLDYDINITKGPKNTNPLYNVQPVRPKPLSDADRELVANSTLDMAKLALPAKPEWVEKFITDFKPARGAEAAPAAARPAAPAKKTAPAKPAEPAPEVSDEFDSPGGDGTVDEDFANF